MSRARSPIPSAASLKARLRWQRMAAQVAQRAYAKDRVLSAWLDDHAHRRTRGVKGADQLARLVREAEAAGMSAEEQDQLLLDYVRGVRRDLHHLPQQALPDRPAA